MIEISNDIYDAVAQRLRQQFDGSVYFNGCVEFDTEQFRASLKLTAIIYRTTESMPEGRFLRIADIVPVWWEFSTVRECGPVLNDFSFAELKNYIIDHE